MTEKQNNNGLPNLQDETFEEMASIKIEVMLSALSGSATSSQTTEDLVQKAEEIADLVLERAYTE